MNPAELRRKSDALHERVQNFAADSRRDDFEQLALAIAELQAAANPGFRRLLQARGGRLAQLADIPPVPSDAFRLARVASHEPALDVVRFTTSGTTAAERGTHPLRRLDTYCALSRSFGRDALRPEGAETRGERTVVVALAEPLDEPPRSSLGYMMARFMEAFDGRGLTPGADFDVREKGRWLVSEHGVDADGVRAAAAVARARDEPLLLLATSFALVHLLDRLAGDGLPLPAGSVVMQTGGFKGRTRTVDADLLRAQLARALGVPEARIVGEYGMTELSSQLYEPGVAESALGQRAGAAGRRYVAPHWLRVNAVDPISLQPLAAGEVGIARFLDLGNVDSAVSVVTQDLIREARGGIELLGRNEGAPARGCSLSLEALLG